jgi:hypothetical protein
MEKSKRGRVAVALMAAISAGPGAFAGWKNVPVPEGDLGNRLAASRTHQFLLTLEKAYRRRIGDSLWAEVPTPTGATWGFIGIYAKGDTVLLAGGEDRISTDNGASFHPLPRPPGLDGKPKYIFDFGSKGIWCGDNPVVDGPHAGLFLSADLGQSWNGPFLAADTFFNMVEWRGKAIASTSSSGVVSLDPATGIRAPMHRGLPDSGQPVLYGDGATALAFSLEAGRLFKFDMESGDWIELLRSLPGIYPIVHIRGETLFVAFPDYGFVTWFRSANGGATWSTGTSEGIKEVKDILAWGDGYLAASWGIGQMRLDSALRKVGTENAGLRSLPIGTLMISGTRLVARNALHDGLYTSDDQGATWNPIAGMRPGGVLTGWSTLFDAGDGVYLEQVDSLIDLSPAGFGEGSFPIPGLEILDSRIIDAGKRSYLWETTVVSKRHTESRIRTAVKGAWDWKAISPESSYWKLLGAEGDDVLAGVGTGLRLSRNAGVSWDTLPAAPFRTANGAWASEGIWLVSSDQGLFRFDVDGKSWTPTLFKDIPVSIVAAEGGNLILRQDSSRYHFSNDHGATWKQIVLPAIGQGEYRFALSGKLACVSRSTVESVYCSSLEELPIPIGKPFWRKESNLAWKGLRLEGSELRAKWNDRAYNMRGARRAR